MNLKQIRRKFPLGMVLLAGGIGASPAWTQLGGISTFPEDSGSALNRHLKELADSPRSLSALLGAAKAALDLGDPQAAVTFYARAEDIAPRDGRIKAGIGAAFLAMEQPVPALKFLEEARALGLPEGVIAADRGLAHDLLGDPAQAQRDYAMAMRASDTDEVRRRLALSRAISGDRGGALAAIDDQVRRGSPAGRRIRAFVLALTGDASGATDAARAAMPAQAAAMQPFFARLPSLRPAERAMAVHFGRFPGDAPPGQAPTPVPSYAGLPPNVILGGKPDPTQTGLARRNPMPEPVSTASRRRPGEAEDRTQLAVRTDALPAITARSYGPVQTTPTPSAPSAAAQPSGTGSLASVIARPQVRAGSAQTTAPAPQISKTVTPAPAATAQPPRISAFDLARGYEPRAVTRSRPVQLGTSPASTATVQAPTSTSLAANSPAGTVSSPAPAAPTAAPSLAPTPGFGVQGPPDGARPPSLVLNGASGAAPAGVGATEIAVSNPVAGPIATNLANVTPAPAGTTIATTPPLAQAVPAPISSSPTIATVMPPASNVAAPPEAAIAPRAVAQATAIPTVNSTPPPPVASGLSSGLASLAATIRALPTTEPAERPARQVSSKPAPSKTAEASVKTTTPAKAEPAKPKEPSRHWVQVAGTADKSGLAREFARIRGKAPKLLAGKMAWTTPLRFTNRLLVGPFKNDGEAQAFVNELAKAELTAFTWTSPAGQEIVKLAAK
jgi:hypothetical protein